MTISLLEYILNNDIENIKNILENDPYQINQTDSSNISIFMYAVSNYTKSNSDEIINYLLQKGADVNTKNSVGVTALHYAMGLRNSNIINILLYNGADVYAVNDMGDTIEDYANMWRNSEALTIIQKHKEDIKTLEILNEISKSKHKLANILEMLPTCIESYLLHRQRPNRTINLQKETL